MDDTWLLGAVLGVAIVLLGGAAWQLAFWSARKDESRVVQAEALISFKQCKIIPESHMTDLMGCSYVIPPYVSRVLYLKLADRELEYRVEEQQYAAFSQGERVRVTYHTDTRGSFSFIESVETV
jgi:hypothetical protein